MDRPSARRPQTGGQTGVRLIAEAIATIDRDRVMSSPSLQIKKAYFARVRRSNYIASLRLAGFQVTPADAERPLPSREAVLSQLRSNGD